MKAKLSPAQRERQRREHRSAGRYAKVNPCELCHRSAGVSYCSDPRQSGALGVWGLVLCVRCARKLEAMTDADALAALKAANPPTHGGAREGAGRPAGSGEQDDWLRLRASSELKRRLVARANREGVTVTEWVRAALEAQLDT